MPRNPLFSTYRQGENRVTASMLAVFERLDFSLLERILQAGSGEASLPFVQFRNQVAAKGRTVPDAAISASFRYLFEVKTERNTVSANQLAGHLAQLNGAFAHERLFLVTPDPTEPAAVAQHADRIVWFNFLALSQAIDELITDPLELVAEQAQFLLRELQALFLQDGLLLEAEDTVVVAARYAYPEYLTTAAYVCQLGRSFRSGLTHMGFYREGAIQLHVPAIRERRSEVVWTHEHATKLRASENPLDQHLATVIERLLNEQEREEGEVYQVFLLSAADDTDTYRLQRPIRNTAVDAKGKTTAWTMGQRYVRLQALQRVAAREDGEATTERLSDA